MSNDINTILMEEAVELATELGNKFFELEVAKLINDGDLEQLYFVVRDLRVMVDNKRRTDAQKVPKPMGRPIKPLPEGWEKHRLEL